MGQNVNALIEHNLPSEDILKLPEYLCASSDETISGQWHWTIPKIDKQLLEDALSKRA